MDTLLLTLKIYTKLIHYYGIVDIWLMSPPKYSGAHAMLCRFLLESEFRKKKANSHFKSRKIYMKFVVIPKMSAKIRHENSRKHGKHA